jgi:hypothetical protein
LEDSRTGRLYAFFGAEAEAKRGKSGKNAKRKRGVVIADCGFMSLFNR